jgi:hypothetical protein
VHWRIGDVLAIRKARLAALAAIMAAGGLSGCVESAADLTPGVEQAQFARRPDASMGAATLAIMSIEGAPDGLSEAFQQRLDQETAQREIAVAPPTSAKYLARGYLSAGLVKDGATINIVWDVFTPDKQRVQRLTDSITIRGSGDDPWAMVSEAALASIAAKSADDLAGYLSNTPEAAPDAALSYAQ